MKVSEWVKRHGYAAPIPSPAPKIAVRPVALTGVRSIDRQRQSQTARAALVDLLGDGWTIASDDRGRPTVVDAAGRRGPDVSLAHAGGLAVAAMAAVGRIGIDIELPKADRSVEAIAAWVLTAPEQALVADGGEAALLACWTLREAAGKALGNGLADGLALEGEVIQAAFERPSTVAFDGGRLAMARRSLGAGSLAVAWLVPAETEGSAAVLEAVLATEWRLGGAPN